MAFTLDALPAKENFTETLVPSSIWKLICILLILLNFKNIPLVWHVSKIGSGDISRLTLAPKVRLLNAFRFVLRSERSRTPITPAQLFQPLITESHGSIMELDYNIHSLSDHSYFAISIQWLTVSRIKQHILSRRRHCSNPSHLHAILTGDRACKAQ